MPSKNDGAGLRERLLSLAEEEIERTGQETLSLRALAAQAGVAPSAPYRHFRDRAALLHALTDRGFACLLESHGRAAALQGSAQMRLRSAIDGFVAFACSKPHLYQLMFASDALRASPLSDIAVQSFTVFETIVAESGCDATSVRLHSLSLWSAAHGAVLLHLHGHLSGMRGDGFTMQDVVDDIAVRYGCA